MLSGEREWVYTQLREIAPVTDTQLCLSDRQVEGFKISNPGLLGGSLGMEYDQVIFDAFDQFNADHFSMAEGLLKGGGLFFLLIPPRQKWVQHSSFRKRFIRLIESTSSWSTILENDQSQIANFSQHNLSSQTTDELYAQQQTAIQAVIHVVNGHRNRPLVLSANRGRGKSAALGIASAALLQQKEIRIIVTAPAKSATDILFQHCARQFDGSEQHQYKIKHHKSTIEFIAPDELIRKPRSAGLLLIDEAAALPVPMLDKLMCSYHRLVFSSTIYGYEGSGQGFEKRFIPRLHARYPQMHHINLQQAIRWHENDPLEKFCYQAFLLDSDVDNQELANEIIPTDCEFSKIDRTDFFRSDIDLGCIYGLLRDAHYRTHPDDLRQIMDDPDLSIYTLFCSSTLVATVIVMNETLPDDSPVNQILAGQRRLKGYHLPQTLIMEHAMTDISQYKFARIMRIAVHSGFQNKGLGSYLLTQVENILDVDFLGASFGVYDRILNFWQQAGYHVIKTGQKANASSGYHTGVVLKSLSKHSSSILEIIREQYIGSLLFQLSDSLKSLDSSLIDTILTANKDKLGIDIKNNDIKRLIAFANGNFSYKTASDAIYRYLLLCIINDKTSCLERLSLAVLIERCVQKKIETEIIDSHGMNGKKELDKILRQAVSELLLIDFEK